MGALTLLMQRYEAWFAADPSVACTMAGEIQRKGRHGHCPAGKAAQKQRPVGEAPPLPASGEQYVSFSLLLSLHVTAVLNLGDRSSHIDISILPSK